MNRNQYISLFKDMFGNVSWIDGCEFNIASGNNPNNIYSCMAEVITNADTPQKFELLKIQNSLVTKDAILKHDSESDPQYHNALVIFNKNEKELHQLLKHMKHYQDIFEFEFNISGKFNSFNEVQNALIERINNDHISEVNTSVIQIITIGLFNYIKWLQARDLTLNIFKVIDEDGTDKYELVYSFEDKPIKH